MWREWALVSDDAESSVAYWMNDPYTWFYKKIKKHL